MAFNFRAIEASDLPECFSVEPGQVGDRIVGPVAARVLWQQIVSSPAFASAGVEGAPAGHGRRLAAFGAGVFVDRRFVDRELASPPRPGLNDRFLAAFAADPTLLPSRRDLGRANAHEGVNLLPLFGHAPANDGAPDAEAVVAAYMQALAWVCRGYRIRCVMNEAGGDVQKRVNRAANCVVAEFKDTGTLFAYVDRGVILKSPGSVFVPLFNFTPPTLRLKEADQDLLLAALDGAIDEELALRLGLSLQGIKSRWRSLLHRLEEVRPEWRNDAGSAGVRGSQRRHRILAYCREHPEELRPYWWGNDST